MKTDLNKKTKKELIAEIEKLKLEPKGLGIYNSTISVNANELEEEVEVHKNISIALKNITELLLAKKQKPVYGVFVSGEGTQVGLSGSVIK